MKDKSTVELMISTMDKSDKFWLDRMNVQSDMVVINQCGRCDKRQDEFQGKRILWIDSDEIGLSRSRNQALSEAKGTYLVLTDDDVEYVDGYTQVIEKAFEKHPDAAIITFQVKGIEQNFKNYIDKEKRLNYISTLHVSSVEIVMRGQAIKEAGVSFAQEFGAGAQYKMGEENIFLYDCLKAGLKIYYVPKVIARLHMEGSSWFEGFEERYFFNRGAVYNKMFGNVLGKIMLWVFALKNYSKYKKQISLRVAMRNMKTGFQDYKKRNFK